MENVANSREALVQITKEFKTSWIKLGQWLTTVASEKLFLEWGFSSFEEYCKVELKLKKSTAIRLTNAYFFITEEQPDLKEKELDLEAVSTLRTIKKDNNCTPEIFEDMMDLVTKGKAVATVKKRFKEMTDDDTSTETQKLFKDTAQKAKKILLRVKPIGTVPEVHKINLNEFVSYCDVEAQRGDEKEN